MNKRLAIIGNNSIEYIYLILQIWDQGDCAVLIDYRASAESISMMLTESRAEKCYIEETLLETDRLSFDGEIARYPCARQSLALLPYDAYQRYRPDYSNREALVLFSSGSTGKEKGVILSHFAINTNADAIMHYMQLHSDDKMCAIKAISHVSAVVGELLVCLKNNIPFYIARCPTTPQYILKNVAEHQITTLCLNPTLLRLYAQAQQAKRYDMNSLRVIYTYGSAIDTALLQRAEAVFGKIKILNAYGLSEAGPRVTAQTRQDAITKKGSSGRPIQGVDVRILDETYQRVPPYTIGGIYIKTPSLFHGYTATVKHTPHFVDGWYYTKDMGYMDADGELYVTGRSDNVIHVGSHNISPEGIEDVIRELKDIHDCVVVGLAHQVYGHTTACVYTAGQNMDEAIRAHCQRHLRPHEIPGKLMRIQALPTTLNGKINRIAARELLRPSGG